MKKINFYVIGGQYRRHVYGGTPTLIGAKRLANRNAEYWDNWQGWHVPSIYAASDCRIHDGCIYPKADARPICKKSRPCAGNTWAAGPPKQRRNGRTGTVYPFSLLLSRKTGWFNMFGNFEKLRPVYSPVRSFYGKATIFPFPGGITLYSYGTPVCTVYHGEFSRHWSGWSATTARHVNEFLQQNGLAPLCKREWCALPVISSASVYEMAA